MSRTFYIETFGCQMNAHDSEKVVGTLIREGYQQVVDEAEAGLILYNTCSIRDKAEQKVFHRLNEYKRLQGEGKRFAVIGCVAQQEGEKIFEKAPYVSIVAGSSSYRNLPEMLQRLEAGETRITGLDDRQTDETFDTEFTARSNPHRGYITIIEGCDKFCAYCVVPYTRGKERSRTSASVLAEAQRIAALGYTEIQLLGQNVNSYVDPSGKRSFAELLAAVGEVNGIQRVRFTTSHPRQFTKDIVDAIDAMPALCDHIHLPVQSGSTSVLKAMQREYTRDWYLERIAWTKAAKRDISLTSDIIVGFPGETDKDFEDTITLLDEVGYDAIYGFKYSPRPNTPAIHMVDSIPEEVKVERLAILNARQREIQRTNYQRHMNQTMTVMVEGHNTARNQITGRSSQNKTVNFTMGPAAFALNSTDLALKGTGFSPSVDSPQKEGASAPEGTLPKPGSYIDVRITQVFPNSLVGEAIAPAIAPSPALLAQQALNARITA
ncbi:tRNA (N6-isopentenyl adenosine(37)-C2)-methylthiotransferase MiaB [Granulicella sp. 5B5]|uniref:tRNA (N6-isopentenyl adenosine(37)-C2)-methylthiotransferase MiaB n=1 Tax=Granulicella sp. 5B5 TaxID=1617967 RepID=UPI0015F5064E|nr:tRNA (N6-isopentenyl adenosine(37)-C2)-methylthiotransferase MiaB [Granulicella sp. 5B5]QMV17441.1 tRNA (N6-isopentenyl adenosine(37)-C2)-methylthiotransferase MiaB [Granulicella sp. 5B5]